MLIRFFIIIIGLVLFNISNSANANEQVALKRLSVADGLNQGTINSIMQDQRGFIWLATDNGINIFDGYSVRSLSGPNNKLKNQATYNLRQGPDGLIWYITGNGELFSYNIQNDEYRLELKHDPENSDFVIFSSIALEPGVSELVATNKTVGIYTRATQTFTQLVNLKKELIGHDSIHSIEIIGEYLFAITRASTFVYHLPSKQLKKLSLENNLSLTNAAFDRDEADKHYALIADNDRVFLGTNDGVFEFSFNELKQVFATNLSQLTIKQIAANLSVWELHLEGDNLLVAAVDGLTSVNTQSYETEKLIQFSATYEHVANNEVRCFLKDRSGIYWLGSDSTGAYYWSPNSKIVDNVIYGVGEKTLSNNVVYSIVPDNVNHNQLWVGTTNGLNLINADTLEVEQFLVTDQSKTVYTYGNISHIQQHGQYLWLQTFDGLKLFNKQTQSLEPFNFSKEVNDWLSQEILIFSIEGNNAWISVEKGTARLDLTTHEFEKLTIIDEKIGVNSIWNILSPLPLPGQKEQILISTNDALWSYNKNDKQPIKLIQFPNKSDGSFFYIDSLTVDKHGVLWLAYSGIGIFGFDSKTFEQLYHFSSENSIIENNVYGIQTDKKGNIWFSSHDGIFTLDSDTKHIRQFKRDNGFIATEFNGGAFSTLNNGKFVYGSMLGLSIFDPEELHNATIKQHFDVQFSNINALSRDLKLPTFILEGQQINLHYDDIGVRVDFSTASFFDTNNVKFTYSLEGPVNFKSPLSTQNYVTFPQLASGPYTLSVQAKSPYTGEYSPPAKLKINVSYAPWASPVAYFIYGVIVLSAFLFWLRRKQLTQKALLAAHEEVKFRENRLQLALTGSNSEVWDWLADKNRVYAKRLEDEIEQGSTLSIEDYIALIHPEDRELFISKWQVFLRTQSTDESFECTYRLQGRDSQWLWYKDLGKIVARDDAGQPTRVTGSYTNITQNKVDEERAQHYGDAFKQTKDWVFIVDEQFSKVTANPSLCKLFDWKHETFDFHPEMLGVPVERITFYRKLLPKVKKLGHWTGEELVQTPLGEEYHVIMNISVSKNHSNNSYHFIFVMTDISAQKSAEQELRILANYDHLTGLPNRTLLLERIKHAIEQANRQENRIGLFFIDLDRFKQINDSLGHDYGDLLLKEITQRLSEALREDDTVARIGGDEFVVLLESFKSTNHLSRIAQKLIDVIEQPVQLNNNVVSVGASIGIALYPNDSKNQEELLRNADVAMYHAKQLGRHNFQFFTEHMNKEAKERLAKESALKLAVKNDEFFNLYQPIIDAHNGKAVGVELLMRWQTGDTVTMPGDFIPLAEELGLIATMTDIALDKAFMVLRVWRNLRPDFYLSINVSAPHFSDGSLVNFIAEKLEQYNLPAQAIKLEVTESAFIHEPQKAIKTMRELADLGCMLALDDFGTGYSSLAYLKELPLDIIKIDRSFVNGITKDKADEAIVDATLVLAKNLDLQCIAEGVETKEQLQYLVERQCHYIQGYLYYPPIPMDEITKKLSEDKVEVKVDTNNTH